MAETLCQKRALEAFQLDPAKWGGNCIKHMINLTRQTLVNMFLSALFLFP